MAFLKGADLISFKKAITSFIIVFIPFFVFQSIHIIPAPIDYLAPITNVNDVLKKGKRNEAFKSPYDGALIHYQVRGNLDSPYTIFAIHGLSAGPSHWKRFLKENPAILKHFRVILPIIRGHGWLGRRSELGDLEIWKTKRNKEKMDPAKYYVAIAEDLKAICERENVPSAIFLGHSMGGDISRYYYSVYPEDVDALILVSTFARYPLYGNLILRYLYPLVRISSKKLIQLTSVIQALERATNYLAEKDAKGLRLPARWLANRILFNRVEPQVFNQFFNLTLSAHFGALLLAITAMGNNSDGYSTIEVPTLVVQGIGDGLIFGNGANKEFARRIPHAKLYELSGRHFPHLHDKRFPEILKDFLTAVYPDSLPDSNTSSKKTTAPPSSRNGTNGTSRHHRDPRFLTRFPLASVRLGSLIAVEKSM